MVLELIPVLGSQPAGDVSHNPGGRLPVLSARQWRNDGVAAASSDGGPTGGTGPPTVLEFLVINFSVCVVLLSNCYIIIYCIVWFQRQPLMVVFQ